MVYGNGLISQGYPYEALREYYLDDGLGNIRYVTDDQGVNIEAYDYDPYGNVHQGGNVSTFTYKGEQADPSGLVYLRARYYDPSTGRFISRDPVDGDIMRPISQNTYHYAADNPINYSDPLGLDYTNAGWNVGYGGIVAVGGVLEDKNTGAIYPYLGLGLGSTGAGGAVTYSTSNPSAGVSLQGTYAVGGFVGSGSVGLGGRSDEWGVGYKGFSGTINFTAPALCF